jgi:hypothetical protein|tara:strand:+ start:407 stop:643 length:237 start_codon:yes stop_codon:yes gene_type:complete
MSDTVFIDAMDGGIGVFIGAGNQVGFAKTPKMLAYILDTKKIYGEVMFTSSMDFASEYGFADNGDARKFFNDAIELRG